MHKSRSDLKQTLFDMADTDGAKTLVELVSPALDQFADQVWCFGIGATPDERRALGLVAQMGAELMIGSAASFASNRYYAGAALVRQLIEVDYLLFLFGIDSSEASRWLNARSDELKRLFNPTAMRKRCDDKFDVDEYSRHCEMGGHPRPIARALVDRHHIATRDPLPVMWMDLANHVVRLWEHFKLAVATCSPTNVYPDRWAPLDTACSAWRERSRQSDEVVAQIAAQLGLATDEQPR